MDIPDFLTTERSMRIFLFVTVALGGGAATLAGRAIASTWRPWWHLALYMLILGGAVRFIHFALFGSRLLSLHYYLVDTAVCLGFGLLSFRLTRVRQMVTQYRWVYQHRGPWSWRRRPPPAAADEPESR